MRLCVWSCLFNRRFPSVHHTNSFVSSADVRLPSASPQPDASVPSVESQPLLDERKGRCVGCGAHCLRAFDAYIGVELYNRV